MTCRQQAAPLSLMSEDFAAARRYTYEPQALEAAPFLWTGKIPCSLDTCVAQNFLFKASENSFTKNSQRLGSGNIGWLSQLRRSKGASRLAILSGCDNLSSAMLSKLSADLPPTNRAPIPGSPIIKLAKLPIRRGSPSTQSERWPMLGSLRIGSDVMPFNLSESDHRDEPAFNTLSAMPAP